MHALSNSTKGDQVRYSHMHAHNRENFVSPMGNVALARPEK